MTSKQPKSQIPKHFLINLEDDDDSLNIESSKQQTVIKCKPIIHQQQDHSSQKYKKYQINSVNSLNNNIIRIQSKSKQKNKTSLKVQISKGKNNRYQNESNISELDNVQNSLNSLNSKSLNASSIILLQQNKLTSKGNTKQQFDLDLDDNQDEKQYSPQKLKRVNSINKNQFTSLLNPSKQIKSTCNQLLNKIFNQLYQPKDPKKHLQQVHDFLHTPLPSIQNQYMRYAFEIHFYKYTFTFHTFYQFYLRNQNGQMVHILKSEKDSLKISSSHMLYAVDHLKSQTKEFTAKLKYNTLKSQYNLYDIDEKQTQNRPRRILATAFYQKAMGDARQIKMYIPKKQFLHNDFIKSQKNKNLCSYFDASQSSFSKKIQVLSTASISTSEEQVIRKQFELKNQGRRIFVVNQQKQEKFYMGKKQNQRYIILASGGLTPLQIFTLAVVNLDH